MGNSAFDGGIIHGDEIFAITSNRYLRLILNLKANDLCGCDLNHSAQRTRGNRQASVMISTYRQASRALMDLSGAREHDGTTITLMTDFRRKMTIRLHHEQDRLVTSTAKDK